MICRKKHLSYMEAIHIHFRDTIYKVSLDYNEIIGKQNANNELIKAGKNNEFRDK